MGIELSLFVGALRVFLLKELKFRDLQVVFGYGSVHMPFKSQY